MVLTKIPINQITVEVRKDPRFNRSEIRKLARSIEELGLLHPVILVRKENHYKCLSGNRRVLAYAYLVGEGKLQYQEIPAFILDDDEDTEKLAILINQLQEKYRTISLANIITELSREGYSIRKIAKVLGISKTQVNRILELSKLPKKIIRKVECGELSLREALKLSKNLKKTKKSRTVPRGTPQDYLFTEMGKIRVCVFCHKPSVREHTQMFTLCTDCAFYLSTLLYEAQKQGMTIQDIGELFFRKFSKKGGK